MMKFREDRSLLGLGLPSGGFHDRYFILNSSCLRLYKEIRSHRPEKEWPVKSLKVYLGVKKKLRPPTCWGLTVVHETEKHEKQQWYLCCETQMELREWFVTFLFVQHDGLVWPSEPSRVSRAVPEVRLGSVSLIPLRGSENEMRRSVAAFTADPLSQRVHEEAAPQHPACRMGFPGWGVRGQQGQPEEDPLTCSVPMLSPPGPLPCRILALSLRAWGGGHHSGTLEDHSPFRGLRPWAPAGREPSPLPLQNFKKWVPSALKPGPGLFSCSSLPQAEPWPGSTPPHCIPLQPEQGMLVLILASTDPSRTEPVSLT
ncbi:hypothetical protein MC885_006485 [Smutsia gigantea]|nr:hypothetical protein MC885_006485 [Smutsia gigantea]